MRPLTLPLATLVFRVKHSSRLHNRYQLHSDGKTSYERRWGNHYSRAICEFAETVLFRYASGPPSKAATSWEYGNWFGKCSQSGEHFIATAKSGVSNYNGKETSSGRSIQQGHPRDHHYHTLGNTWTRKVHGRSVHPSKSRRTTSANQS